MPVSDKELLFNSLAQPHWDIFAHETLALIQRENLRPPKIFISYAWPRQDLQDPLHYPGYEAEKDIQAWLLGIYQRLSALGITVLFDIKTMTLGTNIDQFMQQGVDGCDTVLMVGTQTYRTRSLEPTNVKREVEHIQTKIQQKGSGCVIPILYRGEFHTALPNLGQILGTDCSNEILYQRNMPVLIEGLFQLQANAHYETLKRTYLAKLQDIETHGLSDVAVADFAVQRAQKARDALAMQQEVVNLMLERNAKGHPDYVLRLIGTESPSIKLLLNLKTKYSQNTHVQALFGDPMPLEGQYINVQMLYQVVEEKKPGEDKKEEEEKAVKDKKKEFYEARVTSFEDIFSKKEPLAITQLFMPAKELLTDKQKTNEARPELPPNLVLLQGRAGIGKTTFVHYVTREWAMGRLWQEYHWVFSLRFRDLRNQIFQQAYGKETWTLFDWIYAIHFSSQMNKPTFQSLWTWLIEPELRNKKVLIILDGYDETPSHHPCEQALNDLLRSGTPIVLTSRPYGLSDLPKDRRELEIVGFIDENVVKYVDLYFKQDKTKAQAIIAGLRAAPTLWGSAHIPVTLNVICGVLETENDINATLAKLNTMGGLYETMEMSLLERAYLSIPGKEKEHALQLKPLDQESKIELLTVHYKTLRQYLSKLAFETFSKQQLIITPQEVTRMLKDFGVPVTEIATKINELLELGLLKKVLDEVTHIDANYEFLHLTFQEYYAGHHLLWSVEQNSGTILEDFAKIKLDPRYQLVLWFVAGSIKDKDKFNQFMSALAAPQGGDMLGNVQLGLMVRCTAENWILAQQTGWSKAITKMLQRRIYKLKECFKRGEIDKNQLPPIWIQMIKMSPHSYVEQTGDLDLANTLSKETSFFSSLAEYRLLPFMDWLMLPTPLILNFYSKLLCCENIYLLQKIYEAIGKLGAAAATPDILSALSILLMNKNNKYECRALVKTIVKLGSGVGVVTSDIQATLVKLLMNENSRYCALQIIGQLGVGAATADILAVLSELLMDKDYKILDDICEVIDALDDSAAITLLTPLSKRLASQDKNVSDRAKTVIENLAVSPIISYKRFIIKDGDMGDLVPTITPKFLIELIKLGTNDDKYIRCVIIKSFMGLSEFINYFRMSKKILIKLDLTKQDMEKLNQAVDAIVAAPGIITVLAKLLLDTGKDMSIATANLIGGFGPAAAAPEILAALIKLVENIDKQVCIAAIQSISKLGTAAISFNISAILTVLAGDNDQGIRSAAVEAIGEFGASVVTPDILDALIINFLIYKDCRYEVRKVIGKLGAAAVTPHFLRGLADLLTHDDSDVRREVVEIIGQLGTIAATPDFLAFLTTLLRNKDKEAYYPEALYATALLGHAAATSEVLEIFIRLMKHENREIRGCAISLIRHFGSAAATPNILLAIFEQLVDENQDARNAAIFSIGCLGPFVTLDNVITFGQLIDQVSLRNRVLETIRKLEEPHVDFLSAAALLLSSTHKLCGTTAKSIGEFSVTTIPAEILATIAILLRNKHLDVRNKAIKIIIKFGAPIATPTFLSTLASLLMDEDVGVRCSTIKAIGALGATATSSTLLSTLAFLLTDKDEEVCCSVIETIGELGVAAFLVPQILVNMTLLLSSKNRRVHRTVIETMGKLGPAAATEYFLTELTKIAIADREIVGNVDRDVRFLAVKAIGELGATAATLGVLASLLSCDDNWVRRIVVEVIGKFGPAAATSDFLMDLAKLLGDKKQDVRCVVVEIIGKVGEAASTPDFLALLVKLLTNPDIDVCQKTIEVIHKLGPAAATSHILEALSKLQVNGRQYLNGTFIDVICKFNVVNSNVIIAFSSSILNRYVATIQYLPKLVSTYLTQSTKKIVLENSFPQFATFLIVGAYLSGNISFYITHDTAMYHLSGFVDKIPFDIPIIHAQAQWFIYWTPQIIHSLDEGTLASTLAEIEKSGMNISSQKSLAWFDQSSSSSSSSAASTTPSYRGTIAPKKAYGLSDDAVVEVEKDSQCVLM